MVQNFGSLKIFADKILVWKFLMGKNIGLTSGGGLTWGMGGLVGDQFSLVPLACIPNHSLQGCLEAFWKFRVGGGWNSKICLLLWHEAFSLSSNRKARANLNKLGLSWGSTRLRQLAWSLNDFFFSLQHQYLIWNDWDSNQSC